MNRSLRIYGPSGIVFEQEVELEFSEATRPAHAKRSRTIADTVPIAEIMTPHVVCAAPDLGLDELITLMVGERLGCVPVVDASGRPLGMVTKLDIVTQLVDSSPRARVVADVMMPLAISLDQTATVTHAAALLAIEDMHHVMVVANRRLIGIVSTMDITRWLAVNDGFMS